MVGASAIVEGFGAVWGSGAVGGPDSGARASPPTGAARAPRPPIRPPVRIGLRGRRRPDTPRCAVGAPPASRPRTDGRPRRSGGPARGPIRRGSGWVARSSSTAPWSETRRPLTTASDVRAADRAWTSMMTVSFQGYVVSHAIVTSRSRSGSSSARNASSPARAHPRSSASIRPHPHARRRRATAGGVRSVSVPARVRQQ